MATNNLGLEKSTYLVTTGDVWTTNDRGNWDKIDLLFNNILLSGQAGSREIVVDYKGEIVTTKF